MELLYLFHYCLILVVFRSVLLSMFLCVAIHIVCRASGDSVGDHMAVSCAKPLCACIVFKAVGMLILFARL